MRADSLRDGWSPRPGSAARAEQHKPPIPKTEPGIRIGAPAHLCTTRVAPPKEAAPVPPPTKLGLGKTEQHQQQSTREEKASFYTKCLQDGKHGIAGIMAKCDMDGKALLPYDHQRTCVKKFTKLEWGLIAHDAGLGKTATAFQLFCAAWILGGGSGTMIITAPSATLDQWESTAHDWLNLPNKREAIFKTTKAATITTALLKTCKVLITTRHCIANCYKSCYRFNKKHHQSARGAWVGAWERTPDTPLHAIFLPVQNGPRWSLMVADESSHSCLRTRSTRRLSPLHTHYAPLLTSCP